MHMKPGARKILFMHLVVLSVLSPFLIAPVLNNEKNQKYLNRILSIDFPADSKIIGNRSYVNSNRGDCVHFVGVLMTTSSSLSELSVFWKEDDITLFPNGIDLIWKELESDSVVLVPSGLYPQKYVVPVNLSFYGSDVSSGINELLNEGAELTEKNQQIVVLFTTFNKANTFDIRCY